MSLKRQIMLYRAKCGLSQRAFAAKAGISETTLRKIETSNTNKITRLTRAKIELAMAEEETKTEV